MLIKITICDSSFDATEAELLNGLANVTKALQEEYPTAEIETELLDNVSGGDEVYCSDSEQEERIRQIVTNVWERTDWWELAE